MEDMKADEAAHLLRRALYVEPLNYPLDTIKYPTNGHEHIYLARQETRELFPDNVEIFIDEKVEKPLTLKQWKNNQAYFFSCLCLELKLKKNELKKKHPQKQFPAVENEKDVCLFCLGSELYKKIFKNECVDNVDANLPFLSIILYISQEEILAILLYMSHWVNEIGMDNAICRWIYALLTCLEKPVSDECSEFLEFFHDDCVEKLKYCDKNEKNQFHYITAILRKYFCVKSYKIGPSLHSFSKLC